MKSNPGLSSRFNRVLHFDDYSPLELARIFAWLCEKNHYKLADGTRPKLMLGLTELHRARDRHFGNGRAVRNLFEQAIRRMANRIADIRELSADQLMLLETDDIEFNDLPAELKLDPADDGPLAISRHLPQLLARQQSPRLVPGQESPLPQMRARFRRRVGRAGGERFAIASTRRVFDREPPYSKSPRICYIRRTVPASRSSASIGRRPAQA